jgi:chromosome segregation ATPase
LNSLPDDEAVLFADAVHPTHAARPAGCWAPSQENLAIEQTSVRLLEAMEGAKSANYSADPGPQVPPTVAAMSADAKANADRAEQLLSEAFRTSLEEQCAKVARGFQAEIEDNRNTIFGLRERIDDLNDSGAALTKDVRELKAEREKQANELVHARAELDRANGQFAEVTAGNADLLASNKALKDQVAALKTENADVRRMAEVSSAQLIEVKQDRDMLKGQAETIPGLLLEAAVLKAERDARANEAANFRVMLKDTREDQALRLAQLREDHTDALATAQKRISELEKLLIGVQARSFAAVD